MKRDGMKTMTAVLALGACSLFARDAQFADAPYMNPRLSTEERMNDLISKMEMREKVAVLCTTAGFKMYEIRDTRSSRDAGWGASSAPTGSPGATGRRAFVPSC